MDNFNAVNHVIRYIRNGIIQHTWEMGDKLPSENEICAVLGVNRTAVRSALAQYTKLGILKSVHGKGTYICSEQISAFGSGVISEQLRQTMLTLLTFRRMLEPDICYYTAPIICDKDLDALVSILHSMECHAGTPELFVKDDCDFHIQIAKASQNMIAYQTIQSLLLENLAPLTDMNHALGSCNAYHYHTLIYEALAAHDSNKSRQIMFEHVEKSLEELML